MCMFSSFADEAEPVLDSDFRASTSSPHFLTFFFVIDTLRAEKSVLFVMNRNRNSLHQSGGTTCWLIFQSGSIIFVNMYQECFNRYSRWSPRPHCYYPLIPLNLSWFHFHRSLISALSFWNRCSSWGMADGQESPTYPWTMFILCCLRQTHWSASHEKPWTIQHTMANDYLQPGNGGRQHLYLLDVGNIRMVRQIQLHVSTSWLQQFAGCNWSEY